MKIKTLEDLFKHEIKDLYSAETQLTKAMPKMAKEASNPELRSAFEQHLKETEGQIERLQKIGEKLGFAVTGHTCAAMKGLIEEAKELIAEDAPPEVKDVGLIGSAQRVEHYEIAGYGTARTLAEQLGHADFVKLLEQTLQEEKQTDVKLTRLAVNRVNQEAASAQK
jgi:ferritin-like metal-binding protein YciE